uniref:Uncharacterized protein n=1 Tax=Arundo donax TaxID=35708 RepID=A0A0A9BXM0_ARUDO
MGLLERSTLREEWRAGGGGCTWPDKRLLELDFVRMTVKRSAPEMIVKRNADGRARTAGRDRGWISRWEGGDHG